METIWCSLPIFINIVKDFFALNIPLTKVITFFEVDVKVWNKKVFSNIFYRKNHILIRLAGIQKSPNYPHNLFLQNLEANLTKEYSEILRKEQEFWRLKSKINWLSQKRSLTPDSFTPPLKRRKNNISALKDDNVNWIYTLEEIKSEILGFYSKLFSSEQSSSPFKCQYNPSYHGSIRTEDHPSLDSAPTPAEIRRVVFPFKTTKAP